MIFEADNYVSSIAKVPKFASSMLLLKEVCIKIKTIRTQQEKDITGITEDKHQILNELIDYVTDVSGALKSYALENKNNALYESINFTESAVERLPHSEISSIAGFIAEEADKLTPEELTAEGISAEDLAEFKRLCEEFKTLLQAPRQAVIDRSNYTEELAELFIEAADIKKNVLDNLIMQFKRKDPEFYRKYTAASNVMYRKTQSKNSEEENNTEEVKDL